jgi:hypothetical protein
MHLYIYWFKTTFVSTCWSTWAYGRHLVWGAQYSLPEQANLTLIFFRGGGEVTKIFFPDIPQKIFRTYIHTNILQNFPDIANKNSRNFRKDTNIFLRQIKIFQKSLCFARISQWFLPDRNNFGGARAPPHAPRPIRQCWSIPYARLCHIEVRLTQMLINKAVPHSHRLVCSFCQHGRGAKIAVTIISTALSCVMPLG